MNIYPEDLGPNLCAQVLQARAAISRVSLTKMPPMPLSSISLAKRAAGDALLTGIIGVVIAIPLGLMAATSWPTESLRRRHWWDRLWRTWLDGRDRQAKSLFSQQRDFRGS